MGTTTRTAPAGGVLVVLAVVCCAAALYAQPKQYPGRHGMIDITKWMKPPYNLSAYRALIDSALGPGGNYPNPRLIYFPAGTYEMDDSIYMEGKADIGCCDQFWGQGPGYTVIKLKNNAPGFGNASSPKAFISTPPGNMSFRYALYDLTVEIGSGNPGAMAVDFIVNNMGSMENVRIVSDDGNGVAGLEMTRYGPGPCLIKNLTVEGFSYGIRVGSGEYSPTFEGITLINQKTAGLRNQGNYIAVHGVTSTNTVPAVSVASGTVLLVDADLRTPQGQTSANSAIDNSGGNVYLRSITSAGYSSALKNKGSVVAGATVSEFFSNQTFYTLFNDQKSTLKLPIKSAPVFHDNDTTKWVCTRDYPDQNYASLQKAMDYAAANGKTTVYAPQAGQIPYPMFSNPTVIPPQVKRIIGFQCQMKPPGAERRHLDVTGSTTEPLIIENIFFAQTVLHLQSNRPVFIKQCKIDSIINSPGCGDLFIEDMATTVYLENPQDVWMRQFNPEDQSQNPATRIVNSGGRLWILGIKTEGAGTVIHTKNGGSTELLGSLLYPTSGASGALSAATWAIPAFIVDESCVSLMYTVHLYSGTNYNYDVRETRGGVTRNLCRSGSTNCTQNVGSNWDIPLVVANKGCSVSAMPADRVTPVHSKMTARTMRLSLTDQNHGIRIPAGATGCALYNMRGERVWQQSTTGKRTVTIPPALRSAGTVVITFADR